MIGQLSLLVMLVQLIDRLPPLPAPSKRGRGRPKTYTDHLFLKALVIMIVRRLHTVHELLTVLEQPSPEMQRLRLLLTEKGKYPSRRTWERRLQALPDTLPAQIGCLGRSLVRMIEPWAECGRAVAIDSTILRARGGVWHKKDREAGVVPHSSIDTEAHWTKSGWHGWVYGWKLHLASLVADCWIPVAAELTAANVHDATVAPAVLDEVPLDTRYVLGDTHYQMAELHDHCTLHGRTLIATRWTPAPADDPGKPVRAVACALRHLAAENGNELIKDLFDLHGAVPTTGKLATQRSVLGCVFVYQLAVWYRFHHGLPLNVGMKAFLRAA